MIRSLSGRGNRPVAVLLFLLCFSIPIASEEPILLSFLGDLIPHGSLHRIEEGAFADLAPYLREDDLTFANLETPLHTGRPPSGFPSFNAPPSFAEAAVKGGVEVFGLANNHTLDQGPEGVAETAGAFRRLARKHPALRWSGLEGWGAGMPEPEVLLVRGHRIGFLSVTQFLNAWPEEPYDMVNLLDGSNLDRFLQRLPELTGSVDFFVLGYHGNALEEYRLKPAPEKERLMAELIEAGVDLVWGHHPHVPQTPRIVRGPGGRKVTTFPRAVAEAWSERWSSFYRQRERILRHAARWEISDP